MSHRADIQQLIQIYQRRLQKLQEQEARQGFSTPPAVLLEIEDISGRLEILQTALKKSQAKSGPDNFAEDLAHEEILRDLMRLAEKKKTPGQVQTGSISFSGISGSEITTGNISTQLNVGGDIVTGDKIIQHIIHDAGSRTEPKPHLPYEPETILIPAGPFLMGSDLPDTHERPPHTVELDQYCLGKYPVTNKQYFQFVRQTGHLVTPVLLWDGQIPPDNKLNHPVTGVSWYEALAYCQWLSQQTGRTYSLPSEAQWEKAARGPNGRIYPWGNIWQEGRCNFQPNQITAVAAYPPQNEYGCYDMIGNVREWTSTLWGYQRAVPDPAFSYPWVANDGRDDLSAPGHLRRVYRGGAADNVVDLRCSRRGGYLPDRPGPRGNRHGFRVMQILTNQG